MEKEEKLKEQIKFYRKKLRLSVIGLLTIGGGTASLINEGVLNGRTVFFIIGGILLSVTLIVKGYQSNRILKHLIK